METSKFSSWFEKYTTFKTWQLKEKTGELLDSSWKEQRNRHLLMKMLELEEPIVTAKVSIFLLPLHHMKVHFILKITDPISVLQ